MRKLTFILFALIAGSFAMQMNAQPSKGPARSDNYSSKPSAYDQLGNTSIYWDIAERYANGPGYQYGVSILGKIGNLYYSSTFEREVDNTFWPWETDEPNPGAGFIAALQVNNGTPSYVNALNGTTLNDVNMTTRLEPQGEVAARVVYTLTNTTNQAVTVNVGVWGDIMIGDNDKAPLELLKTSAGAEYGIKMKHDNDTENPPLLCVLFGAGVTGVTPIDDYWFGFFSSNWHANEIVGQYSSTIYNTVNVNGETNNWPSTNSEFYLVEDGTYDSGLGFCWKERTIEPNSSIELSYLISVGEIDFEEPIPDPDPDPDPEPGEDVFTYNVEAYDMADWNNYSLPHMAHVWGEYEHPYGQNGYIEYQVDNETTWTRIPTALISGEDYSLEFPMYFDESVTTTHELRVRFNDGLDNCKNLPGLTWVDVRSYPVSPFINIYEYTGSPVSFVVNVNGEDIIIGGDDQYVNEGTYNVVVAEGAFADNTIGVLTITFSISKPTAVDEISVNNEENGAWYTIDGRRISAPSQPGIYIRNGKKYIVK